MSCRPVWRKFVTNVAFGVRFFILSAQLGRSVMVLAVFADYRLAIVTVSKLLGSRSYFTVKCQSGMCEAQGFSVKREFRSLLTGDRKKSCPHLVELMTEEHASAMKSALPCLGLVSIASVASGGVDAMDVTDSAEVLVEEIPDGLHFNAGDGEWRFNLESTHQPLPQDSPRLVELTKLRMRQFCAGEAAADGSVYAGTLVGEVPLGVQAFCECGHEWLSEAEVRAAGLGYEILVFSSHGRMRYLTLPRVCAGGCVFAWDKGKTDGIFMVSTGFGIAEEVCWSFVLHVMVSHCTLSGFCTIMTKVYKSVVPGSRFMLVKSFTTCFFGWAAALQLDFRQLCLVCKECPEIIGCDGMQMAPRNVQLTPENFVQLDQVGQPSTGGMIGASCGRKSIVKLLDCFVRLG